MTIKDWLVSNFTVYEDGSVIVYHNDEEFVGCSPDVSFLGDTVPPTYAALSALPIASQGWQKIFDQWKEKGKVV